MKAKKISPSVWMLRLLRGETIIGSVRTFCNNHTIEGGFFCGIGAVDAVELAHYDVDKKKYSSKKFNAPYELVSLIGTIGVEKELICHAHAVCTDTDMKTIGGHLVEARISGTAEIHLTVLPKLSKKYDSETGLKLFVFDD